MKRVIIITALLFCAHLKAVHISNNGLGQVLIFPYYTVNGGFNTLISLTNTTDKSKALRVRFSEAANGREVFGFNLYLGPKDVWVGALVKDSEADGSYTQLINPDLSCTVPNFTYGTFTNTMFIDENNDGYGTDIKRMHEGFIEVIEMGVLNGASGIATLINEDQPSANCTVLQNSWDETSENPYWTTQPNFDLTPPTGGLMGKVELINVARGIAISEKATVIDDFSDEVLHFPPENNSPNLSDGKTTSFVVNNKGEKLITQWPTGFEAVSSVLMKTSISNEYVLSDSIGAQTDWIMTMPTRQFHTSDNNAVGPFTQANTMASNCEDFDVSGLWDRDSLAPISPPPDNVGLPPPIPPYIPPSLCYASNNLHLEDTDYNPNTNVGIFSSNYPALTLQTVYDPYAYFSVGWARLDLNVSEDHMQINIDESLTIYGLPIIGFATQQYVNSNLHQGRLANYAAQFEHKSTLKLTTSSPVDINPALLTGLSVTENNQGQVLLFPYYSVRNGLATLISVVNPTDKAQALKVRFREGKNARSVFSFNLYLDAYDVWTSALLERESILPNHIGESSIQIRSSDDSCFVASEEFESQNWHQEFSNENYSNELDDGLGTDLGRLQEGFVEIITLGQLTGTEAQAVQQDSNGVPNNCDYITELWDVGNQWDMNPLENLDYDVDSKIYGSLSIINVDDGTDFSYDATAINRISDQVLHSAPDSDLPNLSSGNLTTTLIDTPEGIIQTTWNSPIDAVSALFMKSEVMNDFSIQPGIGAQSGWVNTYPTKSFYVDPLYSGSQVAIAPFSSTLTPEFGACERFVAPAYNRDQKTNEGQFNFLPDPPPPDLFYFTVGCWSTTVTNINSNYENDSLLDSLLNVNFGVLDYYYSLETLEFYSGWVQKQFTDIETNYAKLTGIGPNGETHEIYGKPVLGFMAQKYVNGTLVNDDNENVLANYAVINRNKAIRKFVITEVED